MQEPQADESQPCTFAADWLCATIATAVGAGVGAGVGIPLALMWCIDPIVLYEIDIAALNIASMTYDTGTVAYTGN